MDELKPCRLTDEQMENLLEAAAQAPTTHEGIE